MNSRREAILTRLRLAPRATHFAEENFSVVDEIQYDAEERVRRLIALMQAQNTEIHEFGPGEWARGLLNIAKAKGLRNLCVAPETPTGAQIVSAAAELESTVVLEPYDRDIEEWKEDLFEAMDGSVTDVLAGIAHTGSLVLWPSRAEPRLMSLVPPVHFAVLQKSRIYNTFLEVIRVQDWRDPMPTNVVLISGPSKTADIEQTLVYGVHGPRQLIVILID